MGAVLYDAFRTLSWREPTEVGDTVLGDENLDRVLGVIHVAHHRYDSADGTALSGRGRGEDRDVAIAGEVARATDAVHHLSAEDVRP